MLRYVLVLTSLLISPASFAEQLVLQWQTDRFPTTSQWISDFSRNLGQSVHAVYSRGHFPSAELVVTESHQRAGYRVIERVMTHPKSGSAIYIAIPTQQLTQTELEQVAMAVEDTVAQWLLTPIGKYHNDLAVRLTGSVQ